MSLTQETSPEALLLDPSTLREPIWVVAPHPDDESLGCGGLIARLAELNCEVWALLLSDGGASHLASPTWPRKRLVEQRLSEWHAGLDMLGQHPQRRVALALPDGALPQPQQPGGAQAVEAVREALAAAPPRTVLLPWRRDPHPDHRAAHALTRAALAAFGAVRVLEYTVWLGERAAPGDVPKPGEVQRWAVRVEDQTNRKEAAIRLHRSQLGALIDDDPSGFVLPEAMIQRALGDHEQLLEVRS
ncbi:PIG-L deacetylase family protein [Deinococcus sp.]|uniref:PIG-L deacetylase family protein n=1 Tax=Deinococcus sp. TaxID=47478 RepID=UPI003B5AAF67